MLRPLASYSTNLFSLEVLWISPILRGFVLWYIAYVHSVISTMRKSSAHPDLTAFGLEMTDSQSLVCKFADQNYESGNDSTVHPQTNMT